MKITYSYHIFAAQSYGGVSRIYSELARYYLNKKIDFEIVAPLYVNEYIRDLPPEFIRGRWIKKYPKSGPFLRAINDLVSPFLQNNDPGIYHETYFNGFKGAPSKKKKVTTVYDLIHELYPQYFSSRDVVYKKRKETLQKADHIICISEHTRKDLLKIYDVPPGKVSAIPLAVRQVDAATGPLPIAAPYFLFVGTRGQYKNSTTLFEAYSASKARREGAHLFCFGGGPFTSSEKELFNKFNIEGLVHQGSGSDAFLFQLYKNAEAYIFPSEYEGFGLPLLEAMVAGCPVICSSASSFPEVAGSAALYFETKDVGGLSTQIDLVFRNKSLQEDLKQKGFENEKKFSWEKCAEDTLKVYQSLF